MEQQDICICYDCLRLMVLFRNMALLGQVWTKWGLYLGIAEQLPGN